MVPSMLLVCVHVTNLVFSERRGRKFWDVRVRSCGGAEGSHHLIVKFWNLAKRTQEAIFASWSIREMIISPPSGKWSAWERLAKS